MSTHYSFFHQHMCWRLLLSVDLMWVPDLTASDADEAHYSCGWLSFDPCGVKSITAFMPVLFFHGAHVALTMVQGHKLSAGSDDDTTPTARSQAICLLLIKMVDQWCNIVNITITAALNSLKHQLCVDSKELPVTFKGNLFSACNV